MPSELDELERKIRQLEVEKSALSKEKDESSKKRLASLNEELDKLHVKDKELTERWKIEKSNIIKAKDLKRDIEQAKFDLEVAFSHAEYEKAGELQYKTIPALEKKLSEIDSKGLDSPLLSEVVNEEEIA